MGGTPMPPTAGGTRWGAWRDASDWYGVEFDAWKSFIQAEAKLLPWKPKKQGEKPPTLHAICKLFDEKPLGTRVRLAAIPDHTTHLVACIHLASSSNPEEPKAPYLYDALMKMKRDWSETIHLVSNTVPTY